VSPPFFDRCALSATTLAKNVWSSCQEENLAYLKYLEVKLVASDFAMAIFTGNSFGQNHSDGVTNVGRIGSISSIIILRPDQSNNIGKKEYFHQINCNTVCRNFLPSLWFFVT
jgi:hypothetical protein